MNLADYLSELLGQHDEVSVPGLGYFVRERINGYYSDKDAVFRPPHHQVKFVPQPKDDDVFTQFVADKKNISLASSKYFAEKFISKLREEAENGKYVFADLGSFQTNQDKQLVFKPYEKIAVDPAFYGYPDININKLGKPHGGDIKSAYEEPVARPVIIPAPIQMVEKEQYFEEETERKKTVNIWLIVLIALAVVALAVFGVYKFYPQAFDKISALYGKVTGKKEDTAVPVYRHEVTADTIKKTPVKDTVAKTAAPETKAAVVPTDTVKALDWYIIDAKFRQRSWADKEVVNLKKKGIDAAILPKVPGIGPLIRVSAGKYPSESDANAAMSVLIKAGKIKKDSEVLNIKIQ